ncbi:MAG: hypothetical protein K5707_02735 [Clostridia bacterium]|nr:hypothetical protein [Clostridia bacterium]
MKKWMILVLCLVLLTAIAGCGDDGATGRNENQTASVNDVLEAGMAEEDNKNETEEQNTEAEADLADSERQSGITEDAPEPEPIDEAELAASSSAGIDVDLTMLSSTMVYSEVYNMMISPETYIGKTVKMAGMFASYYDENADQYYYACIIQDATACCAQGIEFVLTDDYTYPDDYPEEGGDICVVGVFDTYRDGEFMYCTLRDAKLA